MSFWQKIKKHWLLTTIVLVVVIGGAIWWYVAHQASSGTTSYVTATAGTSPLIVSVSGSGQVQAVNEVDLKPQGSSQSVVTVSKIEVTPSEMVKKGQIVAVLDQSNASLAVEQTKASLESAQANYLNVLAGADPLTIEAQKQSILSAQLNLAQAEEAVTTTEETQTTDVQNAYNKLLNSDDSPIASAGNIDSLTPTVSGNYNGTVGGEYDISLYSASDGSLGFKYSGIEGGNGVVSTITPAPLGTHGLYIVFPSANMNVNDAWKVVLPNTQATSYSSNYTAYQTALQNQSTALQNAQNSVQSAELSLQSAQLALAQKQEPPTNAAVASAKAQVDTAQANYQTALNNYNANVITVPFDGQIATVPVQTGDQVSAGTIVATLITTQKVAQITLNELDAAKVQVGQQVTLTFDAIPNFTIAGTVAEVDTVGSVSQGVVNYGVQIAFSTQDPRVKSGMSVTAQIITASEANALVVPNAAVKTVGGQSYVQVVDPKTIISQTATGGDILSAPPTRQAVVAGLSSGTYTEITSGLSAGQLVVTQTVSSAAQSTSASTAAGSSLRIPGLTTGAGGGGGFGGGGTFRAAGGTGGGAGGRTGG